MTVTHRKKGLVFIDFDMLVRHFILSGAFSEVEKHYDLTYVFHHDSTSSKQGIYSRVEELGLRSWTRFEVPRVRMGSWDQLYSITALNAQRGTPNFKPRKEIMAVARGKLRTHYYHLLSFPVVFPLVRRKLLRQMGVYEPLVRFVQEHRPDIIFHPSILAGYFINELLIICDRLRIQLVAMMNSWDNPSVKAMNTGRPTKLVVWGPQTKRHAVEYLGMPPGDVLEFGAAQFQLYREPVKESKGDLCRLFRVPEDQPILLYAGGAKGVNESRHLKLIDAAISEGRVPRCHVLYRPHPWRGGLAPGEENFFDLALRHVTMDLHMEDYYRRSAAEGVSGFHLAEYEVTKKLLCLVEAVISPLSTILLEAIIFGKPVLMFFPEKGKKDVSGRVGEIGLHLAHFKDFWGVPGVDICTEEAYLPLFCTRLLANSQDDVIRQGLRRHAGKFVVVDGPTYAARLLALADELTGREMMVPTELSAG